MRWEEGGRGVRMLREPVGDVRRRGLVGVWLVVEGEGGGEEEREKSGGRRVRVLG